MQIFLKVRYPNSSIIQKIPETLSLVIIVNIICNYLIFIYKDTKYFRDYQFLQVVFYTELAYKSFIVNKTAIISFTKNDITLAGNHTVPIGRAYSANFVSCMSGDGNADK